MFLMPWFDKAKNQCNDMTVQLEACSSNYDEFTCSHYPSLVLLVASFDT